MTDYYLRYKAGDCDAVRRELLLAGPEVWTGLLYSAAWDVARELVHRVCCNLAALRNRLTTLGYRFANADAVFLEAPPNANTEIDAVETMIGKLPMLGRAWFEQIGGVNFCQEPSQLNGIGMADEAGPSVDVLGLGFNAVLLMLPIPQCLALREQEIAASDNDPRSDVNIGNFLPMGGIASNNNLKGFRLPSPSFDSVYYNAGFGNVLFSEELKAAFDYGGFPFWRILEKRRRRLNLPIRHMPNFSRLKPLLMDGFIPF